MEFTAAQLITQLYVGYYNRAPDPEGLNYWIGRVNAGVSLADIANSFAASPEAIATYPYLAFPNVANAETFLEQVYQNLFNRTIDADGLEYYSNKLATGQTTPGQIIAEIQANANTNPNNSDGQVLANKVTVGLDFALMAANDPDFRYEGAAVEQANTILDNVDDTQESVDAALEDNDQFFSEEGPGNEGGRFTLTTATGETVTGTSANDTFNAVVADDAGIPPLFASSTLNVFDQVNGGSGVDTLNLVVQGDVDVLQGTVENVEVINLNQANGVLQNGTGAAAGTLAAGAFVGAEQIWQIGNASAVTGLVDGQTAGFRNVDASATTTPLSANFAGSAASIAYSLRAADTNNAGRFNVEVGGDDVETLDIAGSVSGGASILRLQADAADLPEDLSTVNLDIDSNTTITFGDQMITRPGDGGVFGEVETVDASASSGNLTVNLAWASVANGQIFPAETLDLETLTLGTGNDLVGLNTGSFGAEDVVVDLGAGSDRVLVELAAADANVSLTGGAGADVFAFRNGNVQIDGDDFDADMGVVSIADFGTGADTISLQSFSNFDGSFAAGNAVTAALEALDDDATLYDAVEAVADVVGSSATAQYAQFAFGGTTYLYGDVDNGNTLSAGDLLVDLNGAELSSVNVVGAVTWDAALNATGAAV